jgi:hypothetical protein
MEKSAGHPTRALERAAIHISQVWCGAMPIRRADIGSPENQPGNAFDSQKKSAITEIALKFHQRRRMEEPGRKPVGTSFRLAHSGAEFGAMQ